MKTAVMPVIRKLFAINSLPIIMYGLGMASFFFLDIYVSSSMPIELISQWAETKSYVLVGSTVLLLGLDQVLVRHSESSLSILKRAAINVTLLSIAVTFFLAVIGNVGSPYFLGCAIVALSSSSLLYAVFRAFNIKFQAQVAVNGWKVVMTSLVLLFWFLGEPINFPILIITSCVLTVSILVASNWGRLSMIISSTEQQHPYQRTYTRLGAQYLVALLTLSLSIYLEQILLNANGFVVASAQYFAHVAIILPPFVFLNGYLGFVLGPFVRKEPQRSTEIYLGYRLIVGIGAALVTLAAVWASETVFLFIVGNKISYSVPLASCIAAIGLCRFVYTVPSSFVSMLGDRQQIDRFVISNVAGVLILVVVFYSLVALEVEPSLAVGLASLANWIVRATSGIVIVRKVISPYA